MTHRNNYEYVKKWRENNKELNLQRATKYSSKYYCFKRQQNILFRIDPSLFHLGFSYYKKSLIL